MLGECSPDTREVFLVLHGFGQLAARFIRRFEDLQHPQRVIVAPEALNRFYIDTSPRPHTASDVVGATWMTREDRENEIRDYIRYLDTVVATVLAQAAAPAQVTVLGFSQGAATAARWVTFGAYQPARVIIWSGTLPPDLNFGESGGRWRAAQIFSVWGDSDRSVPKERIDADTEMLRDADIPFTRVTFAGGHELHQETLLAIAPPLPGSAAASR